MQLLIVAKSTCAGAICFLKVVYFPSGTLGKVSILSREEVIALCERGIPVYTATEFRHQLQLGQRVHIVTTRYGKYLRTDRNEILSDNLGYLPDF